MINAEDIDEVYAHSVEIPLNRIFHFNKIKLKCVEKKTYNCNRCYFQQRYCQDIRCKGNPLACDEYNRVDGKNVIFKEVKQ